MKDTKNPTQARHPDGDKVMALARELVDQNLTESVMIVKPFTDSDETDNVFLVTVRDKALARQVEQVLLALLF